MSKFTKLLMLCTISLYANEVDVLDVKYSCTKDMVCSFDVTLKHNDTGWKHYANKFDVLSQSGEVITTRVLFHPHVEEQPFTRSLSGVKVPEGTNTVTIRAHDLVHKYGGKEIRLELKK